MINRKKLEKAAENASEWIVISPSAAEEGFIEGAKWAEKELSGENLYAECICV